MLFSRCLSLATCVVLIGTTICASAQEDEFFNGRNFDGWTTQSGKEIEYGWEVVDGMIHLKKRESKKEKRAGHIVTANLHRNFELAFEWKITKGGNSGIKYRVRKYGNKTLGCEYQIYDDSKKRNDKNSTGSIYDLYAPNDQKDLKPAGEFNSGKIVVQGNRIEHWLNGKQIVVAEVGGEDWNARVKKSKFNDAKDFAQNAEGLIMLTDHNSEVWYRNIKYRKLDSVPSE